MMTDQSRRRLIAQLRLHEDEKLKPYRDTVGKLTIGVGRNLDDRGISKDESAYLLSNDIRDHETELRRALPWIDTLSDVRQRVLIDMGFNMGIPTLLTFKQTLGAVQRGDYWLASVGMLDSLWSRQVGQRAKRLAEMMRTGQDAPEFTGVE